MGLGSFHKLCIIRGSFTDNLLNYIILVSRLDSNFDFKMELIDIFDFIEGNIITINIRLFLDESKIFIQT